MWVKNIDVATYTMDHSIIPDKYLTVFEICRIKFNTQGSTGILPKETSNMLIFMFFMFRILIYEILLKPDVILEKKVSEKTKQ